MRHRPVLGCLAALIVSATPLAGRRQAPAVATVHGAFTIHMILHAIGEEQYDIATSADGTRTLSTTFGYSDRGRQTNISATLTVTPDDRPIHLDVKGSQPATVTASGAMTVIDIKGVTRTTPTPAASAFVIGQTPFALQMMMMRAWHARGEPKQLPLVSLNAGAEPLEIVRVGRDAITVGGRTVTLDRYTVNHLMFGREILWMTADWDLAAAMTFAGGLPLEAVRTEFEPQLAGLYRAGVAQELRDLADIGREVPPQHSGTYAIAGATLIDATGKPPVPDAVVIVRNNRIAAAGPRARTPIPAGMTTIEAPHQTLLPGLWEMHTHASGVEFGPAHLAAGITTARDCGGEFDFLVAVRDAIRNEHAVGPRMLLAGLIDAGGARAFGHVTAETPDEGRAAVARYHAAGFEQIKLYTYLTPDVVKAIADEAHRLGMTVTGHVPMALTTKAGIEAGMDQINHLNYVTSMLRAPGTTGAPDLQSDAAKQAIQFLLDHHTVVDPTASWGEMGSHSKEVPLESFEPGILGAPAILDAKFRGMESNATAEQMHARMAQTEAVIIALYRAGVPIVPGSDTGLVAYGLHRELELYVEAGMTPLEAIQTATIVPARAMGLDRDSGTVEAGKRADLILVAGNPLEDIKALRQVSRVVADGRMYDASALWRSVGFKPTAR
ncbi:MAG TPA: amidohydrolase family protein [Vicinamibacterales bacterium]|nr:amidohydrolase family protein [Vicinamibacterales bacterium]